MEICFFRKSDFNYRGKRSSFKSSQMKFMCFQTTHAHTQSHMCPGRVTAPPQEESFSKMQTAPSLHLLLLFSYSLLCVWMIVSGIGHVCSHVIACFLLKFPCQTLSLFSLSLASYSSCQRRPITVPFACLVSIMGPGVGSPCRQP